MLQFLKYRYHGNKQMFLQDFIRCQGDSAGTRLARWLQPDSYVESKNCRLIPPDTIVHCGDTIDITVLLRDQHNKPAYCPGLNVEVSVHLLSLGTTGPSTSDYVSPTYAVNPPPPLDCPYQVTVKDSMRFHCITMMKAFQSHTLEELRMCTPSANRPREVLLIRCEAGDRVFATWTPQAPGLYSVQCCIDGFPLVKSLNVEVREPAEGRPPPISVPTEPEEAEINNTRMFVDEDSAGLRVRAFPSLQSEQVGLIPTGSTITFDDVVLNGDGVWVHLSHDSAATHCTSAIRETEAWCMQFNHHVGRNLLHPNDDKIDEIEKKRQKSLAELGYNLVNFKTNYRVIRTCNVKGVPKKNAPVIGQLPSGAVVRIRQTFSTLKETWVELNASMLNRHGWRCETGECWVLRPALQTILDEDLPGEDNSEDQAVGFSRNKKGKKMDKSRKVKSALFPMDSAKIRMGQPRNDISDRGDIAPYKVPEHTERVPEPVNSSINNLKKAIKNYPEKFSDSACARDNLNVSSDDSEKIKIRSTKLAEYIKKSQSKYYKKFDIDDQTTSSAEKSDDTYDYEAPHFSSSLSSSPHRSNTMIQETQLLNTSEENIASSSERSISMEKASSSFGESTGSIPKYYGKNAVDQSTGTIPKTRGCSKRKSKKRGKFTNNTTSMSISMEGSSGEQSIFMETDPVEEQNLSRSNVTSTNQEIEESVANVNYSEDGSQPVLAISPSRAETIRAAFAAFLWHEGIVHDAMTCASYLKFHPNLPKEGAEVVTRTAQMPSPISQRHSVEVSNAGNYLNIQQSTLETLTRSAINANANRSRKRTSGVAGVEVSMIKEEDAGPGTSEATTENKDVICVLPAAFRALLALWEATTELQSQKPKKDKPSSKQSDISKRFDSDDKDLSQSSSDSVGDMKKLLGISELPEDTYDMPVDEVFRNCEKHRCELCNELVDLPVTEHMIKMHKGCGRHAAGMGFNYTGIYIRGWNGLCGVASQGFMGPGYMFCEWCRDRCLKEKCCSVSSRGGSDALPDIEPDRLEAYPRRSSVMGTGQHLIVKKNAMFLLDLKSAADNNDKTTTLEYGEILVTVESLWSLPEEYNCFPQCEKNDYDSYDSDIDLSKKPFDPSMPSMSTSGFGARVHRSASMGHDQWILPPSEAVLRRKNRSQEDPCTGPSSLLCNPSAALRALVGINPEGGQEISTTMPMKVSKEHLLTRPVIWMLFQGDRDVQAVRNRMVNSVKVAAIRKHGLEAMNWLLHQATQPVSLHDLMWWFSNAMTENQDESRGQENANCEGGSFQWWSEWLAGSELCVGVRNSLHSLLQSISDLMLCLPPSSPLLLQAMRCWALNFTAKDHLFLHRSQIFNNISRVLSHTEGEITEEAALFAVSAMDPENAIEKQNTEMHQTHDITPWCNIRASSRQPMVESLTDDSTETFWESGEEDRTKLKWVQVLCPHGLKPSSISLHIDNARDVSARTLLVSIGTCNNNGEDMNNRREFEISPRFSGWIVYSLSSVLGATNTVSIRCELRGPDNAVRVRQIKVLGPAEIDNTVDIPSVHTIMQKYTEVETLRVFRLITSQVFGKLIFTDTSGNKSNSQNEVVNRPGTSTEDTNRSNGHNDLKEYMVGILFSRKKLTSLQKQVMAHTVNAISSEAQRARDAWEHHLASVEEIPANGEQEVETSVHADEYCFEMLSMVLALSGSNLGRAYLSEQLVLICDLLVLLHTGSARVQRQVIFVLRRMITEVSPQKMSLALTNRGEASFIDHLVSCISKALTAQVKNRNGGIGGVSRPVTMMTSLAVRQADQPTAWFLRGYMSLGHAQLIIQLLIDMMQGKMSASWAQTTIISIAENIYSLTNLKDEDRNVDNCMASPILWRSLGSLCIMNEEQVERLSMRGWQDTDGNGVSSASGGSSKLPARPMCVNHDDGETVAIMECAICGPMCQECDRFLHLSRLTRHHQRNVCKEEESAIRIDLHEGCGRAKLFWLLALVDQRSLKAMVEFRSGAGSMGRNGPSSTGGEVGPTVGPTTVTGVCRFCGAQGNSGLLAIGNVCAEKDCQEYSKSACARVLRCGHLCGGYWGETRCLPCLQGCAASAGASPLQDEAASHSVAYPPLRQDAEDMCMICFTDPLAAAPAIQLKCGHVFHLHCTKKVLENKWVGPRITFTFSLCPICKDEIAHPVLNDLLEPIRDLQFEVRRKAESRLEYEGLKNAAIIATRYHNEPSEYAMQRYAYYVCFKCKKAYYGGEARCDADGGASNTDYDPSELVCGGCSDVVKAKMCKKHGADFLEYKCRYCCSVAVFFCLGDTHFCNGCHDEFQRIRKIPPHMLPQCPAAPKGRQLEGTADDCPLHTRHPPTGTEFALGCGICRNCTTF